MTIIVTGASTGIGYQTVKALAQSGNHTLVAIARSADKLQKLHQECSVVNPNATVHTIAFDLLNGNFTTQLLPAIKSKVDKVDALINNAGTLVNKPFIEITKNELEEIYRVNVFATFQLIQGLYYSFNPGAHIVNISSMGGYMGSSKFPGLSAYSSSKGALTTLSECLAEEFKSKNIAVNCLCLGAADTDMLKKAFPGYKASVTAEQMASFIVDFTLNGQKYFNGKVLPVSLSTP